MPNKFHTELANYYSKTFDTKVSPQFVERNMAELTTNGWYWEGMDLAAIGAVTKTTRDAFLVFCLDHKSLTQQELWKLCTEFAEYCKEHYEVNMCKTWVYKNFELLVKQGWLDKTLNYTVVTGTADPEAQAKFIKFMSDLDTPKPKPKKKSQGSELGLALWFINKIGDLERAKKVFNAACLAAEALE